MVLVEVLLHSLTFISGRMDGFTRQKLSQSPTLLQSFSGWGEGSQGQNFPSPTESQFHFQGEALLGQNYQNPTFVSEYEFYFGGEGGGAPPCQNFESLTFVPEPPFRSKGGVLPDQNKIS